MTVAAAISLATVLLALFLAISNLSSLVARGWQQQRWFALIALSTCFYSGAIGFLTLDVSDRAILECARIAVAAAALHVLAWMHYSQYDLVPLPRRALALIDAALVALAVAFALGGETGQVALRRTAFGGPTYNLAEPTPFGGMVFALLVAGLAFLGGRYGVAITKRTRYAASHLAAVCVLLVGAVNDVALTLGWSPLPYLLDGAFFIAVSILGIVMTRRWAHDLRALDAALRSRDEFIAIASHELKTPLTPLQLEVQLVQRRLEAEGSVPPQWLQDQVRVLARQVNRLSRLVHQLLEVSRIERRKMKVDIQDVDIAAVVRDAAADFQRSTDRTDAIQVRIDAAVHGRSDPLRLFQVLINLIDNAVKYGEGRPVEVEVGSSSSEALISVSDRGIGIAATDQERIFRKFERVVSHQRYAGLGLGLYITQQIVDALGGSITVADRPGGGTTFTVALPLKPHTSGVEGRSA